MLSNNPFRKSSAGLSSNNPFRQDVEDLEDSTPLAVSPRIRSGSGGTNSKKLGKPDETNPQSIQIKHGETPEYDEQGLRAVFGPGESARAISPVFKKLRRHVLEPEPPQFSTPARLIEECDSFDTVVMYSTTADRIELPHCFPNCLESHYVYPQDWQRFMEDLFITSSLGKPTKLKKLRRSSLSSSSSSLSSNSLDDEIGPKKLTEVWNERFFNRRRVQVVLQTAEDLIPHSSSKRPKSRVLIFGSSTK